MPNHSARAAATARHGQVLKIMLAASVCLAGTLAGPAAAATRTPAKRLSKACDVAREYIRLTEEKQYDKVGELWADDAIFYNPRGDVIRGKPAIKAFYSAFLRKIVPVNRIASLAWDPTGNICVMEIETRVIRGADGHWAPDPKGDFVPTALDRFVVNKAGKVQQMRVYLPPDKAWLGN